MIHLKTDPEVHQYFSEHRLQLFRLAGKILATAAAGWSVSTAERTRPGPQRDGFVSP